MKPQTLNQMFNYLNKNVWPKKLTPKTIQDYGYNFKNYIGPTFGDKKMTAISVSAIREFLDDFEDRPILGNRCLALISSIYHQAERFEFIPLGHCPATLVSKVSEKSRERYASKEELKAIMNYLDTKFEPGHWFRLYVKTCFYTAARPWSLQKLKWGDLIECEDGSAIAHLDGKTGRDTLVFPKEFYSELKTFRKTDKEKVFQFKVYISSWTKMTAELGIENLWLRDLRRTFATIAFSAGVDIGKVGELLNHRSVETTKIYAKLMPKARIEYSNTVADKIDDLLK